MKYRHLFVFSSFIKHIQRRTGVKDTINDALDVMKTL